MKKGSGYCAADTTFAANGKVLGGTKTDWAVPQVEEAKQLRPVVKSAGRKGRGVPLRKQRTNKRKE